ncbi:MAG TPA: hypothetical protein H9746_03855 [Candidatus Butyricicoccus avistercoris]|uniref:Uncharacterized protein n=1 Tax=Candidatus Butyricicoccus avistercoris TaxID=2838518 RepID=A0A9D1PH47_9FIRM|nr:hypothetical protein [Candidatus Butyricicoccus avistercoris]
MIKKLCKYEFRSIFRTIIPIYIVVIAVSIITSISIAMNVDYADVKYVDNSVQWAIEMNLPYKLQHIFTFVMSLAYFAVMVALFVLTVVIILQRFYKGLLCDEGYLMFTLPVKPWQLITSKGITAFVMTILSGIVSCISIFIMMLGSLPYPLKFLAELFSLQNWVRIFGQLNETVPMWGVYVLEFIILVIISSLASLYQIYASMAIGHLAKKNRILMSVVAYVAISMILSFVGGIFGVFSALTIQSSQNYLSINAGEAFLHALLIFSVITSIIEFVVFFVITERILSKKLNLE